MLFSSGHDENHVRRRFFDCLQQGIERLVGQHVDFINDEDFVPIARWLDANIRNNHISNIVDARIGSRVDLQHVHRSAFRDFTTRRASSFVRSGAGRAGWSGGFVTIEGFGDQTRGRGLPYSARA